jgi:hypothetical protein
MPVAGDQNRIVIVVVNHAIAIQPVKQLAADRLRQRCRLAVTRRHREIWVIGVVVRAWADAGVLSHRRVP